MIGRPGKDAILKETFRQHAFALHMLSVLPEARQLSIKGDLSELARNVRGLSSTEEYLTTPSSRTSGIFDQNQPHIPI
jgi:hypothetical protein